ncbi:replication endonuclease [Roseateles asaccharophilus]|uniref:Replication gene A protein-like domain-containing protein n=1 Tax=Roseateles asaccharophilus TaxID=582607 RepID=A0ABU2ACR0_9BURK|nr:replication endonuclease [Roseateles asaccharophilus]MDR7334287.1 hypothetical protein [Roseateles asaccharophilus]
MSASTAISPAELLHSAELNAAPAPSSAFGPLPLAKALQAGLLAARAEFCGDLPAHLIGATAPERYDAAAATAERFQMLLGTASDDHALLDRLVQLAQADLGGFAWRSSTVASAVTSKLIERHKVELKSVAAVFEFDASVGERVLAIANAHLGRPVPGDSLQTKVSRILDRKFWLRHYSKLARQRDEFSFIKSGFVSAAGEKYISDRGLSRHSEALAAQQAWLESTVLIDHSAAASTGKFKYIKLADAAKRAAHRDASLWAFLTGIEQLSIESNLECALVTLTAPSSFHACPGTRSKLFDGVSTPLDSHKYIASRWTAFQRDLDNEGLAVSGVRATEPQGDGTCHWHVWLHYAPDTLPSILSRLAHYFQGDTARRVEPVVVRQVEADLAGRKVNKKTGERFSESFSVLRAGALVQRSTKPAAQVDFSVINRSYASGATYMAKYTVKSFDQSENSKRVHAWRWTWGVRGFQLFGLRNCRGLWDELYRATERPFDSRAAALWDAVHAEPGKHTRQVINPLTGLQEVEHYEGGTAAFIRLQGGLAAAGGAAGLRIKITYVPAEGRYGDFMKRRRGLRIMLGDTVLYSFKTREPGRWVMSAEGRVEQTFSALRRIPFVDAAELIELTCAEFKALLASYAAGVDPFTGEILDA